MSVELIQRRSVCASFAGALLAPLLPSRAAGAAQAPAWPEPSEVIDLWPRARKAAAPEEAMNVIERSTDPAISDRIVNQIKTPRIDVFRPWRPNGAAVLVIPGGGYLHVVKDREGYEVAQWLAAQGFTAFVLFYRLPREGWSEGPSVPLADAQRAMRLIHARSANYGIDPSRIMAMGMSAGGHLCADLATRHGQRVYRAGDAIDQLSARPMAATLLYPVVTMEAPFAHPGSRERLLGADPSADLRRLYSPDRQVDANTPPLFIVHAEDDNVVPVDNALLLHAACRTAKVPVELHLFENGGHGFAIRRTIGKPVGAWPSLFLEWARVHGVAGSAR